MRLVLLTLCLVSCGYYEAPKAEEKPMEKPSMEITYPAPQEAKPVVTEYRKEGPTLSKVIQTSADLEPCGPQSHGLTVYIETHEALMLCDGSRGIWTELKGSDKEAVLAPHGLPKKEETKAPRELSANEWRDPVTGLVWLLGTKAPYALLEKACEEGYSLPLRGQVVGAVLRGLPIESAWTGDLDLVVPKDKAMVITVAETPKEESRDQGESHSLLCVEK